MYLRIKGKKRYMFYNEVKYTFSKVKTLKYTKYRYFKNALE